MKPLQGSVFKNMRKIILSMPDDANGNTGHRSVLGIDKRAVSKMRDLMRTLKKRQQRKTEPLFSIWE